MIQTDDDNAMFIEMLGTAQKNLSLKANTTHLISLYRLKISVLWTRYVAY